MQKTALAFRVPMIPPRDRRRRWLRPALASVAAFGMGGFATQELYEVVLVPLLDMIGFMPLILKVVVLIPQTVLGLFAAWTVRSVRDFGVASLAGGVAHHALFAWFALEARPGHYKSIVLDDSQVWSPLALVPSVLLAAPCLACGLAALRTLKRVLRALAVRQSRPSQSTS